MRLWIFAVSFWVTAGCIGGTPSGVAEYDEVAPVDDAFDPSYLDATADDDVLVGGGVFAVPADPTDPAVDDGLAPCEDCDDDSVEADPGPALAGCRDESVEQFFGATMRGCGGTWRFQERAYACQEGWHVCDADEWVERAGHTMPGLHYWTAEVLQFAGYDRGECVVMRAPETGVDTACPGMPSHPDAPMRVCAFDGFDAYGNECELAGCGLGGRPEAEFFGGCGPAVTAGALCCL